MNILFILVEPAVPGNVGAAARAIKTMGFSQLRLVNPCDYLSMEAKILAHASTEILEGAEVFQTLDEALKDLDLSIASTAKVKDARLEYHRNTELPDIIKAKGKAVKRTGVVFGREEYGLSNEEIRMCDIASSIPLKQSYPSLNLSQAVMLYAYTLAELAGNRKEQKPPGRDENEFRTMMERSKELLRRIEADRNPALYNRILERIALLGEEDIHLLLSVLAKIR